MSLKIHSALCTPLTASSFINPSYTPGKQIDACFPGQFFAAGTSKKSSARYCERLIRIFFHSLSGAHILRIQSSSSITATQTFSLVDLE